MESNFGNVLVQQYPIAAVAPSGPQGTWSKSIGVSVALSAGCNGPDLGKEINANRGLIHVVERIIHESCNQRGLADCWDRC